MLNLGTGTWNTKFFYSTAGSVARMLNFWLRFTSLNPGYSSVKTQRDCLVFPNNLHNNRLKYSGYGSNFFEVPTIFNVLDSTHNVPILANQKLANITNCKEVFNSIKRTSKVKAEKVETLRT